MYTSNQLADLWKESLNSDGHLYLQNELSLLASNVWTQKRPRHMTLEIQALAWDKHKIEIV